MPPAASCQIYKWKCGKFRTDINHLVRGLVKRARANLQCYDIDLSVLPREQMVGWETNTGFSTV